MKRILLLGASGSIGKQSIDIIKAHKDELELVGVSVYNNLPFLREILNEFKISFAYYKEYNQELIEEYPSVRFYFDEKGLEEIVKENDYDLLVNGLVGFVGFLPTLRAIENKKDIALANKETLVAGGEIIKKALKENNVTLLPIDSEHSAILQCLNGHYKKDVNRLIITASGGPFKNLSRSELKNVTIEDALKHPTWSMGNKITIDSATMMNKAFEIMEAHYLFDIEYENIEPIIHRTSIIHSMVEYKDGTIMAQLSSPDMRLPIRYALLYPNNLEDENVKHLDLKEALSLDLEPVDYNRFPLLKIIKEIAPLKGNIGSTLVGANDEAVNLFLNRQIGFLDIEKSIIETLKNTTFIKYPTCEELLNTHKEAREYVRKMWNI